MTIIRKPDAPMFELPGLKVRGLASPTRGSSETCVWTISVAAGAPAVPHSVTREEIFVGISGRARVTIAGEDHVLEAGDALIVPRDTTFALANPYAEPFEAFVTLPVGAHAMTKDGPLTPPWTV